MLYGEGSRRLLGSQALMELADDDRLDWSGTSEVALVVGSILDGSGSQGDFISG